MKKVLLIHGLCCTANVFNSLEFELQRKNYNVTKLELSGLDDKRKSSMSDLIRNVRSSISCNQYDLIFAHGVGAYLLTQSLDVCQDVKVVLCNPVMADNVRPELYPMFKILGCKGILDTLLPKCLRTVLYRRAMHFMCNDINKVKSDVIEGLFIGSNKTMCSVLQNIKRLPHKKNKHPQLYLIYGTFDRCVNKTREFQLVSKMTFILDSGHMSYLEQEDMIVSILDRIIKARL